MTNATPSSTPGASPTTSAIGIKSYVTGVAGLIALVLLPYLHGLWPVIPAVDATSVQIILGAIVSLGIMFHRIGLANAAKWVLDNIAPVVLPQLEVALAKIVQDEVGRLAPQLSNGGIDVIALNGALAKVGASIVTNPSLAPVTHDVTPVGASAFVAVPRS